MKGNVLIVIDMQKDFVDGALGTAEAQAILPAVEEKVKNWPGTVIFTKDTHEEDYLSTQEGGLLPVEHCIRGSEGWQLAGCLEQLLQEHGWPVYEKPAFGSMELMEAVRKMHSEQPLESIECIGLCTDICVVSNALLLKAALPEVPVYVDASCCAGTTPENHQAALTTMACCQVLRTDK